MIPETRYARSGGVHVAFQVFGQGEVDIVVVPGWFTNVEVAWEVARFAEFYRGLATFARVILFDKRGTGLSDRDSHAYTLEDRMDDVRAVMDAAGSDRAVLYGTSEGGPMCVLFAATYPERTASLVLSSSYARRVAAPDYPWGTSPDAYRTLAERMESDWTDAIEPGARVPSLAADANFRREWMKYMRQSASPRTASNYAKMNGDIDVRSVLPTIRVPTLVIHATGDQIVGVDNGRYLAEQIPGAQFVPIDSPDHSIYVSSPERVLQEIQRFVLGDRAFDLMANRALCTVMFTDIVGSTQRAAELGDERWSSVLDEHHSAVREQLSRYRGREVKTTGDGFQAIFDGPARAIQCAVQLGRVVPPLGLGIRVGLHTGECLMVGSEVEGIAVHIAARVAALAQEGEVLVSQTVRDLVAGSGIAFADRGAYELRGVPDRWHLYAVDV